MVVCCQIVHNLLGKVVNIHDDAFIAGSLQLHHDMPQQGLPPYPGTSALGMVSVSGFSRVPRPAAKIIACFMAAKVTNNFEN